MGVLEKLWGHVALDRMPTAVGTCENHVFLKLRQLFAAFVAMPFVAPFVAMPSPVSREVSVVCAPAPPQLAQELEDRDKPVHLETLTEERVEGSLSELWFLAIAIHGYYMILSILFSF